jgi:hypothetical protein
MAVVIDDFFTEVETSRGEREGGERSQSQSAIEEESDMMLLDRIGRLEKRQLRLLAD